MSAHNWAICPQCSSRLKAKLRQEAEQARAVAESEYGRVDPEEWVSLHQMALAFEEKAKSEEATETFRENYEQGILDDGSWFCKYSGGCTKCDFHRDVRIRAEPGEWPPKVESWE